jgi:hypothetical protein
VKVKISLVALMFDEVITPVKINQKLNENKYNLWMINVSKLNHLSLREVRKAKALKKKNAQIMKKNSKLKI